MGSRCYFCLHSSFKYSRIIVLFSCFRFRPSVDSKVLSVLYQPRYGTSPDHNNVPAHWQGESRNAAPVLSWTGASTAGIYGVVLLFFFVDFCTYFYSPSENFSIWPCKIAVIHIPVRTLPDGIAHHIVVMLYGKFITVPTNKKKRIHLILLRMLPFPHDQGNGIFVTVFQAGSNNFNSVVVGSRYSFQHTLPFPLTVPAQYNHPEASDRHQEQESFLKSFYGIHGELHPDAWPGEVDDSFLSSAFQLLQGDLAAGCVWPGSLPSSLKICLEIIK